ncbi:PP2C family protein-serine/threonine phosphatase [Nocardioides bruguierae]|uniref:PP2C family protein-serine/threonine phosphatase n=1 Tax=Nocardioides bruguierae TaxID=2945102 RepID=UPI002020142B|nr:protein phosphatase 2C domain-containing protein [Nocardioides bruguierae]MCL8024171.1 protein phosphatase 2C domain-containing protein [Nocardioides bruguierae]
MQQVQVRHAGATDVGRVRTVNEDAFLDAPPVFAVADGMGGHDGGDVASAFAVEELGSLAGLTRGLDEAEPALRRALAAAQGRIADYARAQADAGAEGFHAGTTVVCALLVQDGAEPAWLLGHLGDSRAYRFADGRLEQLTRDHSLVQDYVDAGVIAPEEAATHPERNVITRALDGRGTPSPDLARLPVTPGERLLLCSDGVTGMIDHDEIADLLATRASAAEAAADLVSAAVAAGGRDNATAVVVDVDAGPGAAVGVHDRPGGAAHDGDTVPMETRER